MHFSKLPENPRFRFDIDRSALNASSALKIITDDPWNDHDREDVTRTRVLEFPRC